MIYLARYDLWLKVLNKNSLPSYRFFSCFFSWVKFDILAKNKSYCRINMEIMFIKKMENLVFTQMELVIYQRIWLWNAQRMSLKEGFWMVTMMRLVIGSLICYLLYIWFEMKVLQSICPIIHLSGMHDKNQFDIYIYETAFALELVIYFVCIIFLNLGMVKTIQSFR